jgi:hypothetical protein
LAKLDFTLLDQTAASGMVRLEILEIGDCAVVAAALGVVPLDTQVGFGRQGGQVLQRTGVENGTVMALEFDAQVHWRFLILLFLKMGCGNFIVIGKILSELIFFYFGGFNMICF